MSSGVYLHLFHGRKDPKQSLENWGDDGPTLGPLKYVHTTYASLIHLGLEGGDDQDLTIKEGMVFYRGVYYGDWSVFDTKKLDEAGWDPEPPHPQPDSTPTGYECSVDDGFTWRDHNVEKCHCHEIEDTIWPPVLRRKTL